MVVLGHVSLISCHINAHWGRLTSFSEEPSDKRLALRKHRINGRVDVRRRRRPSLEYALPVVLQLTKPTSQLSYIERTYSIDTARCISTEGPRCACSRAQISGCKVSHIRDS